MVIHDSLIVSFALIGVFSTSFFLLILSKYLYNYINYKDIFYSEKNIEIKKLSETISVQLKKIETLEKENNQITTLIIEKIKEKI